MVLLCLGAASFVLDENAVKWSAPSLFSSAHASGDAAGGIFGVAGRPAPAEPAFLHRLYTELSIWTGRRSLSNVNTNPTDDVPIETDAEVAQENMNHFIDSDIAKGVAAVFSTVAIVSAGEAPLSS